MAKIKSIGPTAGIIDGREVGVITGAVVPVENPAEQAMDRIVELLTRDERQGFGTPAAVMVRHVDLTAVISALQDLQARMGAGEVDAARWRALMKIGRIKMQGSAGVDPKTGERTGGGVHFGAEFWAMPPKPEYAHLDGGPQSTAWGVHCLTAMADQIIELEDVLADIVGKIG